MSNSLGLLSLFLVLVAVVVGGKPETAYLLPIDHSSLRKIRSCYVKLPESGKKAFIVFPMHARKAPIAKVLARRCGNIYVSTLSTPVLVFL